MKAAPISYRNTREAKPVFAGLSTSTWLAIILTSTAISAYAAFMFSDSKRGTRGQDQAIATEAAWQRKDMLWSQQLYSLDSAWKENDTTLRAVIEDLYGDLAIAKFGDHADVFIRNNRIATVEAMLRKRYGRHISARYKDGHITTGDVAMDAWLQSRWHEVLIRECRAVSGTAK